MDGRPAVVVNSIEAEYGFYTHRRTMRGYSFFYGLCGGWSIPFSPSQLKWLEEELRQRRGDGRTWGNCPNQVEWFPNGRTRDTGEQAAGWMDRLIVTTTGAPLHPRGHLFRVVSEDQCSPIEHVTGKWVGGPRRLSTMGVWIGVTGGQGSRVCK